MDNSEQATMKKTIAPPKKDAESMSSSDTESDAEECEVKQIFQPAEGSAGGKVALDHSTCPTKVSRFDHVLVKCTANSAAKSDAASLVPLPTECRLDRQRRHGPVAVQENQRYFRFGGGFRG